MNRSYIFRRAHELARWNSRTGYANMSQWLSIAWAEARKGTLPDFSELGLAQRAVRTAQRDLLMAEGALNYDMHWVRELRQRVASAEARVVALTPAPFVMQEAA